MKFCILSCSGRADSESARVSAAVEAALLEGFAGTRCTTLDLASLAPASWDPYKSSSDPLLEHVLQSCEQADAIVFVAPEWGGMAPPVLKHVLQLLVGGQISHKPGLLIGISSGAGGTYPIAELRAFGFKNSHMVLIPHHLVIRNVADFQASTSQGDDAGARMHGRLHAALHELHLYASALAPVRGALNALRSDYQYGM